MPPGVRADPYPGFRFRVELDSVFVAGFSEVTGLEVRMETESYWEGGVNTHSHSLPTRFEHSNATLRRGMTESPDLWNWADDVRSGRIERRTVRVYLLDSTGEQVRGWAFTDAYPVRWTGPELRADQSAVAVETLELAHEGVSKMDLPGGESA